MFAFLRSPETRLSSDTPGVAHPEKEKDFVNPAESAVAVLDSDSTPNFNPGELTFEEGKSLPARILCESTFC